MSQATTNARSAGAPRRGPAVLLALGGAVLVAVGWLIPSQFKSLPVSILAEAGRGTPGLPDAVLDALDQGRPGVGRLLAEGAVAVRHPAAAGLRERVAAYLEANPDLAAWGEVNPHLTGALGTAPRAPAGEGGIVRQILPAASRTALRAYLGNSRNATVRALLATAELPTFRQFLPVFSSGGAPLEATILLAALLVQGDELGSGAARELRTVADEAVRTGEAGKLEIVYLDLLSLGRRHDWGALAALTRGARSLDALARLRHLQQIAPEAAPVIAAAAVASQRPDAVAEYVMRLGELGTEALAFALHHGSGSVDLLLRQGLPPDGELTLPPVLAAGGAGLARRATDPLVRFALANPVGAVAAKVAAYLLGGLLFFLAAERVTALHRLELTPLFRHLARAVGAGVVCLLFIILNEPYLALGSQPAGYELRLVIPVLGSNSVESMNESTGSFPLDAATMVSITFFFLLQVLVYVICLLKIREIERKDLPGVLKLKLAENEENLFDSGLYVGIAGTSAALVMQVLGLIQANLLAAYSSNLFGILCVAVVKIRHVRPFKQAIILALARDIGATKSTE